MWSAAVQFAVQREPCPTRAMLPKVLSASSCGKRARPTVNEQVPLLPASRPATQARLSAQASSAASTASRASKRLTFSAPPKCLASLVNEEGREGKERTAGLFSECCMRRRSTESSACNFASLTLPPLRSPAWRRAPTSRTRRSACGRSCVTMPRSSSAWGVHGAGMPVCWMAAAVKGGCRCHCLLLAFVQPTCSCSSSGASVRNICFDPTPPPAAPSPSSSRNTS